MEGRRTLLGPGQELWQVLNDKVDGEAFSSQTRMACCALAMTLTEVQMQTLVDVFQYFVDPQEREWGSSQLAAVSSMPAKFPWCKTAILVANLVCTTVIKGASSSLAVGCIAAVKDVERLKTIKSLSSEVWVWMEDSLRRVLQEVYVQRTLQKCDSHTLLSFGFVYTVRII